ncbi:TspO/MBR family protein [Corynebacterium phoceense]
MPPKKAFPLVWTPLFVDLGVVMSRILTEEFKDESELGQRQALAYAAALAVNLGLNAGWSAAFFRAKNRPLATGVAAALTLSSADLVRRVAKHSTPRAVALSAYPAWCGFAAALSGAIMRLNK